MSFKFVITKKPNSSFVNAISQNTSPDRKKPDYNKVAAEHEKYIHELSHAGVDVLVIEDEDGLPDDIFVEDTHFILGKKLIIELNPGADSRQKEPGNISDYLPTNIERKVISKKNRIDGGDILKDGKIIYIGLSQRTKQEAIEEFQSFLPHGYQVKALEVPQGLHLKSGMTSIDRNFFIIQESFEPLLQKLQKVNPDIQYFTVPNSEKHAANVLVINDNIFIPKDCSKTREFLRERFSKFHVREIDTSEVSLVDGAITCCSLLFKDGEFPYLKDLLTQNKSSDNKSPGRIFHLWREKPSDQSSHNDQPMIRVSLGKTS